MIFYSNKLIEELGFKSQIEFVSNKAKESFGSGIIKMVDDGVYFDSDLDSSAAISNIGTVNEE